MSVILFNSQFSPYTALAQSYEGLKDFMRMCAYRTFTGDDDQRFYKALRRLYFANVACYLCQYHDDTPLPESELTQIETFMDIDQSCRQVTYCSTNEHVSTFSDAWGRIKYNLSTNDGELYKPVESYTYIEELSNEYNRTYVATICK